MIEPNPCKGCTERYTACHDHCEKHKKWVEQHRAEQKHLQDQKGRWCIPSSVARDKKRDLYAKGPAKGHKGGEQ
jgi:hypothetical protein